MIPLLFALFASAQSPYEPVLEEALTEHTTKLQLGDDAPDVYHLRYHLMNLEQRDVRASLGHLVNTESQPYRMLSVELRVGEPNFDNTGFGGWENGFATSWLPAELTPRSLRLATWRLTDTAYKQALEQYARKKAQFRPPKDYPGDYTMTPSVVHADPPVEVDTEALDDLARHLSAAFADQPKVVIGEVHIGHESGSHLVADSAGTRVSRGVAETSVRAVLHVRADDGMLLTDSILWSVRRPSDLPTPEAMRAEVDGMTADLLELADAPALPDEVVGPVLFTDDAAIDLFRTLLVPQLEGTPPEVPFESWLGDLGAGGGSVRLGRRVLPPGWTVTSDPQRLPDHPGAYTHDMEGTPAQPMTFVEDGIVKQVAMSRVPRTDRRETNGHARGSLRSRLSGRPSLTSVDAPKERSARKLHKRALKLASAYDRDWYLRIDKLQEPAVRSMGSGGGFVLFGGDDEETLARPVKLTKVYADGRTEVFRGARFSGVQRWALRDIAEAGPPVARTFMLPPEPGSGLYSPTGGLPVWMQVPNVLVGELELLPAPGDPNSAPLLPHPAMVTR